MDPAVHVGGVLLVIFVHGLRDDARLKRSGGVIEINDRFAVHGNVKVGKILPDSFDIKVHDDLLHPSRTSRLGATNWATCALTDSRVRRFKMSSTKPWVSSRVAILRGTPRACR